jgi:CheY-like chemotaxis protein
MFRQATAIPPCVCDFPAMTAQPSREPAQSLTILLVENHPDTAKYLRRYLEQRGHAVDVAGSVREALDALAERVVDVLISDIGLPDGTGWELMERASLPPTVYALAMSGFGASTDYRQSAEAGFRHHLLKPFTPEQLDAYLAEALGERAAR